jgi:hypothetical protein
MAQNNIFLQKICGSNKGEELACTYTDLFSRFTSILDNKLAGLKGRKIVHFSTDHSKYIRT